MKKSLRFGAAAIAAVATLSLASCGFGGSSGDSGGEEGSTTLDLLVPSYSDGTKANWETVIDGFEKANPDIKVELEVQSWDNLEKVVSTKIQANEAPDIYNGGPFAGFVGDELLYPTKDVVSEDTYSDFQESFLKNAEVDGTAYALPLIASARALFVNNALLDRRASRHRPTGIRCWTPQPRCPRSAVASRAMACRSAPKRRRPKRPSGCGAAAARSAMPRRSRSTPRRTSWVPSRSRR